MDEQEIQKNIDQGSIERLMDSVATQIMAYHDALKERGCEGELLFNLVSMYADKHWDMINTRRP